MRSRGSRSFATGTPRTSARSTDRAQYEPDASCLQLALHGRFVNDHLRGDIREFTLLPCLHLFSHRFKVPLHAVDTDRDTIDQRKRFRVFGENWSKHAWDNVSEPSDRSICFRTFRLKDGDPPCARNRMAPQAGVEPGSSTLQGRRLGSSLQMYCIFQSLGDSPGSNLGPFRSNNILTMLRQATPHRLIRTLDEVFP